ncbi:MAG TPA: choice-of-anchor D domain-containing protein, partial [Steroidobacteraceae bacterium]|nr:choice-of-anchor D domain-containing protein [Steroidobacteraceae bacterium]
MACAILAVTLLGAQGAVAATGGSGASLPYSEVQAENAATNGTVLPVTYTYNTLGGEASGRRAVTLTAPGQFVEFTLPSAANSIVVRFSIPDSGNGAVYTAPLALFTGSSPGGSANVAQPNLTLTNAYSHYYGSYPFTNSPGTNHHHYYDEVSALLPNLAAGTLVRLQMLSGAASSVTIDFADFEQVTPAASAPANSITVVADTTGGSDAAPAINSAIAQAAGRIVWIPAGRYLVNSRIMVNNVTIRGAGMWHTVLNFSANSDNTGFHGNMPPNPSTNVHISNLRMNGNIQQRNDDQQTNSFGGGLSNSSITGVWTEHFKVGAWMFGPATGLTFTGVRFRNTNADGINFNGGFTNSLVTQSHFRNNGDDGLAMWSLQVNQNNSFTFNTVETTLLANGIAIYGGANNSVTDNRVIDTGLNQGGGIHVGNRFGAPALSGITTIARNTLIRSGNLDTNWQFGVGSIWFDARDGAMNGTINVTNLLIQQAPYSAIMFVSGPSITNVNFNDVTVQGVGTYVLQLQVGGSASFQNVVASNIGRAGIWNCLGAGQFNVINNGGNDTWINSPLCQGTHPTPVFPPPVGGLLASPTALDFGSQAVNTNSAARAVSVSNTGSSAAPISSIAASGDYTQTNNCGTSVPANGSCTVNVVFRPTVAGTRSGSLSINSSAGNASVALSGTGAAAGASISGNPTSLTFTSPAVGSTSPAQAVQLTNTGTLSAAIGSILASGDFAQTNNCGASLAVSASCTVNVTFTPTVTGNRTGTLTVSSDATNSPTTVALSGTTVPPNTNLAAGRPATASTTNSGFPPGNATDGNVNSYWESVNNLFPQAQTLTVELANPTLVGRVVLKLPPAWGSRTQTMSILGGTDGTNFPITFASSQPYQFVGGTNVVNITFATPAQARFVRLSITANTGWQAGQISELEVYAASAPATLSASPSPVAFGNQTTNTFSTRAVTITNTGSASANVSGVTISGTGQFTQTNNCGALAASATCTVTVRFAPTTAISQTGTLTVASNASNPSLTVPLSGTGVPPGTATLSASPSPVAFGNQATNTSSTRAVTITNTGSASGNVTGVSISGGGQFTQTNNCGTLAANATCTVTVTFAPTSATSQMGTLTVSSNASNPSLTVPLSGTGVPPGTATLSASPSPVAYGDQVINTSSSRTVTITNSGTGAGTVSGVSVTGPFTQTNNCNALAAGANCTVTVTFASANPLGAKSGTLTVNSNASNPSLAVSLSGNATNPVVVGCEQATNVAAGKTPVASGTTGGFPATNSNDNNLTSYWEGPFPNVTLTAPLGTNYRICSVTVRLNPDPAWGQRTQTYSIEGRDQAGGNFNSLVGSGGRVFTPGTTAPGNNNTVSLDVPASAPLAADVRLTFTANTGAPGGQVAEVIIMGVPGPNPDLTISGVTFSPSSPTEITPITLSAMVNNIGISATPVATTAKFFCGTTQVGGSANVSTLNAGVSTPVSVNIGTQPASTCALTARVDDPSLVVEQNENNNTASGGNMSIAPITSADLVPSTTWSPSSPSGGQTVTFATTIVNQGNQASSATPHTITVQIRNQAGTLVSTLSPASQPSGVINANGGSVTVTAGTWVAANGRYTVTTTVAPDQANEAPVKQTNNTTTATLVVGLGANMPYDMYEAEDGTPGSGAVVVGPNRTIGDIAGEASGRRAVRLPTNGSSVQWTTRASTNTAVVRFSIPDGSTATLGVFNGAT